MKYARQADMDEAASAFYLEYRTQTTGKSFTQVRME